MNSAPTPDGRHDDLEAPDLEGLALVVPDDARSLDADRDAYLAECEALLPNSDSEPASWWRMPRALATKHWKQYGFSGPLLLTVLVVVGLVGSMLTVFSQKTPAPRAQAVALASTPDSVPGQLGGLLPDVTVSISGHSLAVRDLRPAMLLLVPPTCVSCAETIRSLQTQAREYNLRFEVVGRPDQATELASLDTKADGSPADVMIDQGAALVATYQGVGLTAVLVRSDGIVGGVLSGLTANRRLEPELAQLNRPG